MKKTFSFILAMITAAGFAGWGAFGAQAATTYTTAQVATHNTASDCWLIISGNVYDVTNFIPIHPGGNAIVPFCGTDATSVFDSIHNASAFALLPAYLIGSVATVLTAPTGLAASSITQTSAVLNWTASTGGVSPITYTIMRDGSPVGTATATTFASTGLTASTTYTYVIKATDSATPTPGSASSSQISVTTLANVATSTSLTAPTNVHGTPTQTSVALSWTGSTGGVSPITYTILRNGSSVGTTASTTFTNTGLTASTAYTFIVRATDSATPTPGSASSSQISVMTLGNVVTSTPLTAPTNVHGTPTQTSVALSWTGSTGGVSPITYTILRNGSPVGTTVATTFTNTGLTASTTYMYVINATDSATPTPGSASSSQISVMTLGTTVTGGGGGEKDDNKEMGNEMENEHEHSSTSTNPTGGDHHGSGDDGNHSHQGGSTGTGSHEHEGGSGSSSTSTPSRHQNDD